MTNLLVLTFWSFLDAFVVFRALRVFAGGVL